MADTCNDCRFTRLDDGQFQCIERPPLFGPGAVTGMGYFPGVLLAWWCGKWAAWVPTTVVVNAGDNQTATVLQPVAVPPSVLVTDASGRAAFGVEVTFAVTGGAGIITGAVQTTDRNGIATIGSWSMGAVAGPNSLSATPAGVAPIAINATGQAAIITLNGGDAQTAPVGQPLAIPPSVLVTDQALVPLAGVPVVFAVTGGGSIIFEPNAVTDINGIASPTLWIMGLNAGVTTVEATAGVTAAGNPVAFTATAEEVIITLDGGDAQVAVAGTVLPIAPSVLVTDQALNPMVGYSVTFAVTGGGGSVQDPVAETDAFGIAAPTSWTLGAVPGPNTLTATSAAQAAGNPVPFTATGT